jgi:hypothetical protein
MFVRSATRRRVVALVALLLGTLGSSAVAQIPVPGGKDKDQNKEVSADKAVPGTWQTLGRASVDEGKDKDEFKIEGSDRFRRLRVKAEKADIEMKEMKVYYEDGENEELDVKSVIKAGGSTRPLELRGNSKRIRKVTFNYSSKSRKDNKAMVILEGQK